MALYYLVFDILYLHVCNPSQDTSFPPSLEMAVSRRGRGRPKHPLPSSKWVELAHPLPVPLMTLKAWTGPPEPELHLVFFLFFFLVHVVRTTLIEIMLLLRPYLLGLLVFESTL